MFTKSIDNKNIYTDQNNLEVVDIGESFMDVEGQSTSLYGIYKVPKGMEMRPDKVSISAYGTDEYTEMVCVFNNIKNPFTIEENDIVYMISLNNIYDNTYEPTSEVINSSKNNGYETFRNFLDKSRLPKTVGSEKNTTSISKSTKYTTTSTTRNIFSTNSGSLIPNVASASASAIEIENGKIIYGTNNDNYSNVSNTVSEITSNNSNESLSSNSNYLNNALSSNFSKNEISTVNTSIDLSSISLNNALKTNISNYLNELLKDNKISQDEIDNILNNLSNDLVDNINNLDNLLKTTNLSNDDISDLINNVSNNLSSEQINNIPSDNGIYNTNGTVVFGKDSSVGCATNGISLGDYMVKRIKNEI